MRQTLSKFNILSVDWVRPDLPV